MHTRAPPGFLCDVSYGKILFKYWLPVLLWMALIFGASADAASSHRSSRIIEPFVRWLLPHLSERNMDAVVFYVRKCAHVTEYGVLALLFWRALRRPVRNDPRPWQTRLAVWVVGLAFLYALTDEIHQRFVPNREGRFHDVLIDTGGAALAMLALWGFVKWRERRRLAASAEDSTSQAVR